MPRCIEAADRAERERLLRYCARPPFALERLPQLDGEQLSYDHPQSGPRRQWPADPDATQAARPPRRRGATPRASTATVTSACSRPTHRGAQPSPPSRW